MGLHWSSLLTPSELEPREGCTAPNWEDTDDDFRGIGNKGTLIVINIWARYNKRTLNTTKK